MRYIVALIILIIAFGCNKRTNSFEDNFMLIDSFSLDHKVLDNDIFLQYLEETFNETDVISDRMFVILPCTSCSGCDKSVYSIFTQGFINNEDFTLIICDPNNKGLLLPTLKADNVKYDSLSKMADYDFGYGYPTCMIVKDNNVVSKYTLTPDVIHWVVKCKFSVITPKEKQLN